MKKNLLLLGAVVALGTGVSFAVAHWVVCRHASPTSAFGVQDVTWLKRELKLNKTQTADIEKATREFQIQLNRLCAVHCAARFALGDELAKPKVDIEKSQACVEQMNAAQAKAEQATLVHILKVRSLLTDEQVHRYSVIIGQQVCTMPMGTP